MVSLRKPGQACPSDGDGRQDTIQNQSTVMWVLPSVGRLKLNTDAAMQSGVKVFQMGAVIRDHPGVVLVIRRVLGFLSVENAEATAIRDRLNSAKENHLLVEIVESDSLHVV